MATGAFVAVDLGASSGRVMHARVGPGTLELTEVSRFRNGPVTLPDGLHWDVLGLYTDILGADGRGTTGDVWGIILIPSYYLTDGLQLVARYQYANGDNDGLRLQSRYERLTAPPVGTLTDGGRGENYHAFYLGLNYYLYGHKLKLMAGAEYHTMDNGNDAGGKFEGITGLAGVRMFF